jgi:coronin-1B/1C/6
MSRVVRQSKYRHVFGTPQKPENCYTDIRLSTNQWDSNYVTANTKFFAVCWEAAGGGSFAVVPWVQKGKLKADYPLVSGHKGPVLDVDANPFNDYLFASASEDGTAKIWKVPEGTRYRPPPSTRYTFSLLLDHHVKVVLHGRCCVHNISLGRT